MSRKAKSLLFSASRGEDLDAIQARLGSGEGLEDVLQERTEMLGNQAEHGLSRFLGEAERLVKAVKRRYTIPPLLRGDFQRFIRARKYLERVYRAVYELTALESARDGVNADNAGELYDERLEYALSELESVVDVLVTALEGAMREQFWLRKHHGELPRMMDELHRELTSLFDPEDTQHFRNMARRHVETLQGGADEKKLEIEVSPAYQQSLAAFLATHVSDSRAEAPPPSSGLH